MAVGMIFSFPRGLVFSVRSKRSPADLILMYHQFCFECRQIVTLSMVVDKLGTKGKPSRAVPMLSSASRFQYVVTGDMENHVSSKPGYAVCIGVSISTYNFSASLVALHPSPLRYSIHPYPLTDIIKMLRASGARFLGTCVLCL